MPRRAANDPQKHNNKRLLLICIFNGDSWTNYIFMDYKIRRGKDKGEMGGPMPLAMQTGTRVPSAPTSVQQEGPQGPAGRRLLPPVLEDFVVYRTNYTTSKSWLPSEWSSMEWMSSSPNGRLGTSGEQEGMRGGGSTPCCTESELTDVLTRRRHSWEVCKRGGLWKSCGPPESPPEGAKLAWMNRTNIDIDQVKERK